MRSPATAAPETPAPNAAPASESTPSAIRARRQILIETLTACLQCSKVREVVDAETVRSLLQSAINEMWRGGELRLDSLWRILRQQPELSEHDAAVPLLAFSTYEEKLGVRVKLPEALASVPFEERLLLREGIGFNDASFDKAIAELQQDEAEAADRRASARILSAATTGEGAATASSGQTRKQRKVASTRRRAATLIVAALVLVASAASLWFTVLRDNRVAMDFGADAGIEVRDAKRIGEVMTARIATADWSGLKQDEKTRRARLFFERARQQGIVVMTLTDSSGRPIVSATAIGGLIDVQLF